MRTYYFGNMEFGTAKIGTQEFEICLIHDLEEVNKFETMEDAEQYAQDHGTGEYIVADHDSIEIVFANSCTYNGSLEINDTLYLSEAV
jgi:hypothetical protein